ncbi:MAG: hypothetical protein AAF265_07010 [Pseudomonadota bacterium]
MIKFTEKLSSMCRFRRVVLSLAVFFSACGAESAQQGTAVDVKDVVDVLPTKKVVGDWQGLLSCAGRDFPTRIAVNALENDQLEVRWTVTPALGRRNYISPDGRSEITDRVLTGEYDSVTGRASVRESISRRPLQLDILFGKETVLLSHQRCDFGVLQRPPADAIADLQSELLAIQEEIVIGIEDQQGECPRELQEWIHVGLELPLDRLGRGDTSALWTDEVTRPIFGEPVAGFRAQRRREIRRALAGRCMVRRDPRQQAVVRALMGITDYRAFRDGRFIELAGPVAEDWVARRALPLLTSESLPELSNVSSQALSRVPRTFNFDRLLADSSVYDSQSYAQQTVALNEAMMARRAEEDFLGNMRDARLFHMLDLWQAALVRDDIRDAPANTLIEEVLIDKAVEYSRAADTARDAVKMAGWVSSVDEELACSEAQQDTCSEAAERLRDRLDELADKFAETEQTAFVALEDEDTSLQNLSRLVEMHNALVRKYGRVLEYGDFRDLMEDFEDLRFDWQRDQEAALAQQLASARTTSALTALDQRYFASSDLATRPERHLKRLGKVYDEQLTGTRPFAGTGSDAYLNALYNREFNALARMDAELLSGVAPMFQFMAQQINSVSDILGAAGRPLQSAARELNNPSAVTAVALRYLLNYEDQYESCLGADAITVTFTERVDTVTRTGSGIEVSRIRGVPVSTTYRIKREHADLFEDVFSKPKSSGADGMLEALFGLQGVSQLTDAVEELMDEHRCDSDEVRGFEQGLLAYYANRKRQWGR